MFSHMLCTYTGFYFARRTSERKRLIVHDDHSTGVPLVPNSSPWRQKLAQWDVTHFAIPLSFSAFAAMWKKACTHYVWFPIPNPVYMALWALALFILLITLLLYISRLIIWPGALKWDFANPRQVNFFFAPVIIGSLLVIGSPEGMITSGGRRIAFCMLSLHQLSLSLYLYGEWLFGLVLIDVVHPVMFMQVVGYFLLANIASSLALIEVSIALFSVGGLFWVLIFMTSFQHTSAALSRRNESPAPTFFMFIAPPAQAAIALVLISAAMQRSRGEAMSADWPMTAKVVLYIDLFLYMVIFRVFPAFWIQKFTVVWWAYIFPMSAAASATLDRCGSDAKLFWAIVSGLLVSIATIAMTIVSLATYRGVVAGQLPRNPAALQAYKHSKGIEEEPEMEDPKADMHISLPVYQACEMV